MTGEKLYLNDLKRCFIIAEAGVNHNGDIALAKQLVEAANECGADAVKFQTFKSEKLVTAIAPQADYQAAHTGKVESQFQMLKRLELDPAAHRELADYCQQRSIIFLSTPFHAEASDLLDQLEVPAFKLGSGEVTNLPLLAHVAAKGRPMILSTGMSCLGEVEQAVRTIEAHGNPDLALLHCVSNYPALPIDVNLRAMRTMAQAFGRPVGYSDHIRSNAVAFAAVALGARIIEKHLTLDRTMSGPDHKASLEPAEFSELVTGIREVEAALGNGIKHPAACEQKIAEVARKSVVASRDLSTGAILDQKNMTIMRPGTGIPPKDLFYLIGRRLAKPLKKGDLITLEDLA